MHRLLLCADPLLGKVDKSSFSQEMLMDILIDQLRYFSLKGMPPMHEKCVRLKTSGVTRNDANEITEINWCLYRIAGSLALEWLQPTLRSLRASTNSLYGSLNLFLPKMLMDILVDQLLSLKGRPPMHDKCVRLKTAVTRNDANEITMINWCSQRIAGSLALEWLPPTLRSLRASTNSLYGSLNLTDLPSILEDLFAADNQFSGEICLIQLPKTLRNLNLGRNRLSGSLNLEYLPENMRLLCVEKNQFHGRVSLGNLPKGLTLLYLNDNVLEGEIDLTRLPATLESLGLACNDFCGETDFSQLPASLTSLTVMKNENLSGRLEQRRDFVFVENTKIQIFYIVE
eukprot:CAMPEP_0201540218 /NCGR_PEP_ID=MMETSP0161_2-20130828/70825_1 /ASSEMBLY_ACC=CAM_ASM_000251 /TAXON_ID=180227 /ORGANISM="Neoparamoeba aestuarina, Strain SoJaBio B1-5/56/2" /LENGTH=342 /DNA_ID=CAMNT_0047947669 /DNA_START=18 /DNA_END=1047 /DNA_ORIENTATION=-